MKELLTASRITCLLQCHRKHFYRYEIGLKPVAESHAFRFGSAWHRAMEARWHGLDASGALTAALDGAEFDELDCSTLAAMIGAYYGHYRDEIIASIEPEIEFRYPLAGSRSFDVAGKIDGLGLLIDCRKCLVEHKTAGEDITSDSDYWLRLRFNQQVYQYVSAARALGHDPALVIYDVARKPVIRPLAFVPVLDETGAKIVLDADQRRVFKKDGTPKATADKEKGETLHGAPETPDQFGERLMADIEARPDFYLARRDVPILEQDLAEFEVQRLELSRLILALRKAGRKAARPEQSWARNCSGMTCRGCEFASFCLNNVTVDPAMPPAGFVVGEKNPELTAQ